MLRRLCLSPLLILLIVLGGCKISGKVTYQGAGLEGVTVTLSGDNPMTATTNDNGEYTFEFVERGNYTVTPSKTGFSFNPESINVKVRRRPVSGIDFEAEITAIRVPADYPTIQEAVNAAFDGDIILVADGIYNENVDVYQQVTIISENGYHFTMVKALNMDDHVFEVIADNVTIEGFTTYGATGSSKAGIYIGSGIANCMIKSNLSGYDDERYNFFGFFLNEADSCSLVENICNWNSSTCIALQDSNNNDLTANTCVSQFHAIVLTHSDGNSISDNYFHPILGNGIRMFSSNNNEFYGNTIIPTNRNGTCIWLWNRCNYNIFSANICEGNGGSGILLDYSDYNIIADNTFNSNRNGIWLDHSNKNFISNNLCNSNKDYGLVLFFSSENNTLIGNTFSENDYGIRIDIGINHSNDIFLNNFIDNNVNVWSEDSINNWRTPEKMEYRYNCRMYFGFLGNYYSDHKLIDSDGDGITDEPYDLSGDELHDLYPLVTTSDNYIFY